MTCSVHISIINCLDNLTHFILPSLSLIETDLQTEQEAKLQDFLIKRLSRSTMHSSSGSLATLSNTDISQKPVICYYKLIKGPKLDT